MAAWKHQEQQGKTAVWSMGTVSRHRRNRDREESSQRQHEERYQDVTEKLGARRYSETQTPGL